MNRCRPTQLDEILHEHVPWQPHEPHLILRSKVKVIFSLANRSLPNCFHRTWKKSQLITPFSACRLLDPFQRYSRSNSRVVRNPVLHLAWWNFARTCTSKTLLNFKVVGQSSRPHEFFWCFSRMQALLKRLFKFGYSSHLVSFSDLIKCCSEDLFDTWRTNPITVSMNYFLLMFIG